MKINLGQPVISLSMKRKPQLLAGLLLFAPTVLRADPISVSPLDPQEMPRIWGALFLEVLLVMFILRPYHLRPGRFLLVWFTVNLFTFYELLPMAVKAGTVLFHGMDSRWPVVAGEFIVFAFEAALLLGVSRWSYVRYAESTTLPIPIAVAASFWGNLTSILAYFIFDTMR